MDAFHEIVKSVAVEQGRRKLTLNCGSVELDEGSGALRHLSAGADGTNIEVSSGIGLVAAELSRLEEETKGWGIATAGLE
ncbi:MAG: hypothetical protein O2856_07550 [Planctomycetota bacterium]|nr:hypothetical protein [Planctomycetota bacterium]